MKLSTLLDHQLVHLDRQGIWVSDIGSSAQLRVSQQAWENIYDFDMCQLEQSVAAFNQDKLNDHLQYLCQSAAFGPETIFLEVGCGPAYIGNYLLSKHHCKFIGIDFNYHMLLMLKQYFQKHQVDPNYYLLVYASMDAVPLRKGSVSYIYGGGVLEHLPNTQRIIQHLALLLKPGGVMFNTVPAFNLFWLTRFYNNIPYAPKIRQLFEWVHFHLLKGKVLSSGFGYELSFSQSQLRSLHQRSGTFSKVVTGCFAFHPFAARMPVPWARQLYYWFCKLAWFAPVYYVWAIKTAE